MEHNYDPHTEPRVILDRFTTTGRKSLRSWYRLLRGPQGLDRWTAHVTVEAMAHAAKMGSYWF